jgi:hypothetical protein
VCCGDANGRLRLARANSQVAEVAQDLLLAGVEPVEECGITETRLAFCFAQAAELAQAISNHLLAALGQFLPPWQQLRADIFALLGRHLFQDAITIAQFVPLLGRHPVPPLQILANLRLAIRWKVLEARIVPHESFLFFRGHLAKPSDPFGWQARQILLPLRWPLL